MARDYSKEARKVRTVKIADQDLDKELRGVLKMYAAEITEAVDAAGLEMVQKLVKLTKKSAPKASGAFAKSLTYEATRRPSGTLYTWGAKAPHYRLTHLLVHGHPTVNGKRVPGDPFLEKALATVLPEYEEKVKEALKE